MTSTTVNSFCRNSFRGGLPFTLSAAPLVIRPPATEAAIRHATRVVPAAMPAGCRNALDAAFAGRAIR